MFLRREIIMKRSQLFLIGILVVLTFVLSACMPGIRVTGTPGVSLYGNTVYLAYGPKVYALKAESGIVEWKYPQENKNNTAFYAPPLVADDFVYIGDLTNNFHKINKNTGASVWKFSDAKGHYIGKANEENGVVYAPNNDGKLYAINASDGSLKWTFKTGHYLWAQPLISDKAIFVASMDHKVYAVSKDGEQIWATEMIGAVVATPVLSEDGSKLFVGSLGHELTALDTSSGEILWSFDSEDSIWGQPALVAGTLYFGNNAGKIFAVDANTGDEKWQQEIPGPIVGGLSAMTDGIALVTEPGALKVLNFDGSPKWEQMISGKIFQAPAVDDQHLVVGAIESENILYAFNQSGTQIWSKTPEK